jgi:hypothetical protein
MTSEISTKEYTILYTAYLELKREYERIDELIESKESGPLKDYTAVISNNFNVFLGKASRGLSLLAQAIKEEDWAKGWQIYVSLKRLFRICG